jgi:hypothetical protein
MKGHSLLHRLIRLKLFRADAQISCHFSRKSQNYKNVRTSVFCGKRHLIISYRKQAMCEIIYFYTTTINMGTCEHYMQYDTFYIPENPVFSTRGKIRDSKKNFCHTEPLPILFYVAKVFFRVVDSTPGTKNGVFRYKLQDF